MSKSSTSPRRRPERSTPPRPGAKRIPSRSGAIRAWVLFGVGALGFLILLWVGTKLLGGGGEDDSLVPLTGPTGPSGTGSVDFAEPPPAGSVPAVFPGGATGTRLVLKVIALGDNPYVCVAESIRIRGEVRSAYHHGCSDEEDIDRLYFLVRVTNRTDTRVPVTIDGFLVRGADDVDHEAIGTPPLGAASTRFFPLTTTLGPRVSLKRWVTVDGSDGIRPERLIYADGPETLIVRFPDAWV
jgi:hypothetical protein